MENCLGCGDLFLGPGWYCSWSCEQEIIDDIAERKRQEKIDDEANDRNELDLQTETQQQESTPGGDK